uniref:G_PROTEIN_RECEP_F1_2 domain-containing protein n=1 Tax=Heterorhabditis bacteriophora TaxID=37862 RepID=A0A1I7WBA7_HETBA
MSSKNSLLEQESVEEPCIFFECYLHPFSQVYDEIHIPLSISICVFGTVSNVFNIIVLTRSVNREFKEDLITAGPMISLV